MKRRSFLQTLLIVPTVGAIPSLSFATTTNAGAGLEKIITIIRSDKRLKRKVSSADREIAIGCAKRMNEIIMHAIVQTGAGNHGQIQTQGVREINDYIFNNHRDEWVELHGDDENSGHHHHHKGHRVETGFHKVRGNGARTKLFGRNAINSVADGIYHLGFQTHRKNRLLNEDGNANVSFRKVAQWLNSLLREELKSGRFVNHEVLNVGGDTDTGLDRVIDIICNDRGLQQRISLGDLREGSRNANEMNKLILEAISETNAGEGGSFSIQNIRDINHYLVNNYASRWAELHGDDEGNPHHQGGHKHKKHGKKHKKHGKKHKKHANKHNKHGNHKQHGGHGGQYIETGYHKVQSDGAKTRLYGKNAVNKVFDGIYHLGFETPYKRRLVNEDGNKNATFAHVAIWLSRLLAEDLANGTI